MNFVNTFSPEQKGESDLSHFRGIFRRAMRKAVVSALPGRMLPLALFSSALSLCCIHKEHTIVFPSVITCTVMLILLAGLFLIMRTRRSLESLAMLVFASALTFALPMMVVVLFEAQSPFARISYALVVFCVIGFLPILSYRQLVLTASLGSTPVLLLAIYQDLFLLIALAPWLVLALRNGVALGVERVLSSATLSVLRLREELHEELMKQFMLEGLHCIFGIQRFGYSEKGESILLYTNDGNRWSLRPNSPLSELAPLIWNLEGEAGIMKSGKFGVDVSERLRSVFGVMSNTIAFYSFGFTGVQRPFRVFFPLSYVHWIVGKSYGFQLVLLYFLVLSQNLEQSLAREFGSIKFRATSDALEREQADLNYIVHLVNNVTQEVSSESAESKGGDQEEIQQQTSDALYALAAEVSEFRLARELDSLLSKRTPQRIYTSEFRQSFERYVRAVSKRFDVQVESTLSDGGANEVFYEDDVLVLFLIRTLARVLISQAGPGATFSLTEERASGNWKLHFRIREAKGARRVTRADLLKKMSSVELKVLGLLERLREELPSLRVLVEGEGSRLSSESVRLCGFSLEVAASEYDSRALPAGGRRVLFVDDNQQILGLYKRIAGALKLQAWTAASVGEALQFFERHGPPSLIVMDHHLPDGTGHDLVTRLGLFSNPTIGVLVVSGEDREAFIPIEKSLGPNRARFLSKPISQQLLVRSIRELLERS